MAKAKAPLETKHQRYEASGKRQGSPVSTRLTDTQIERLDARLAPGESRAAFLNKVLLKAIGWNEAPKRPNPPNQKAKR